MAEEPQHPAGWYPDPHGRHEMRWWDGARWTDQISDAGMVGREVPEAEMAPATAAASTTSPPAWEEPMREGLRARLRRERPDATLAEALSAVGGTLGVIGFYLLLEGAGRGALLGGSVLVLFVSAALALSGKAVLRPAALAGAVIAPLVFVGSVVEQPGWGVQIVLVLLLAAGWFALFLAPGFRGAPVLLAAALLAGWAAVAALAGGDQSEQFVGSTAPLTYEAEGAFGSGIEQVESSARASGLLTLALALGLAITGALIDRNGWRVLATPFLAVTILLGVGGAGIVLEGNGDGAGAGALLLAVGSVIALAGGVGRRRGSMWIGVILGTLGIVVLVTSGVDDGTGAGVLLVIAAGSLVFAAEPVENAIARARAAHPDDGGGADRF